MLIARLSRLNIRNIRRHLPFVYVLIVFLAYMVGKNIIQPNVYFWLLLLGAFGGALLLKDHRTAVVLLVVSVFLLDWLSDVVGIIPRQITWLPELILIGLFFKVLFSIAKDKKLPHTAIDGPMVLLIGVGVLSAVLNSAGLEVLLFGFRSYFKFVVLFYAVATLAFDDGFLQKMIKLFVLLAFIQIPVAIAQRFFYLAVPSGDIVGGTLGVNTSGTLTLFLMSIISLLVAWHLNGLIKARALFASMVLLFIPMVINETKITFIIFPLLLLFLFGQSLIKTLTLRRILVSVVLSVGIFYVAVLSYNLIYVSFYQKSAGLFAAEQVNYVALPYTKSGSLNRLAQISFAHDNVTKDWQTAVLGVGPGNASDSFFAMAVGDYFKKYEVLKIDSTFLGRVIWEYGYLGLAIFMYMLFKLWVLARTINRESNDAFERSIAMGFQGTLLIVAIATIYSGSLIIESLGSLFWFIAGYLQRRQTNPLSFERDKVGW